MTSVYNEPNIFTYIQDVVLFREIKSVNHKFLGNKIKSMSKRTHQKYKQAVLLFLAPLLFQAPSNLFAEEASPKPDIQLVMMGNTLVAVDDTAMPTFEAPTLVDAASTLEKEIMLRKLVENEAEIKEGPLAFSQSNPEFKKETVVEQADPTRSVLSQSTFFDHLDEEIVDPFRSPENFDNFLTRMMDFLDYNVGVFGEYDDNIFLTSSGKTSDFKTVINQSIEIKYPMDKFYLEFGYGVNLEHYGKIDDLVDTQVATAKISYYPFDKLSLGFSNVLQKIGNSSVATSLGDQTLSLGYLTDTLKTEVKYELWKNGFFEIYYGLEHIDFSRNSAKIFIDRTVHTVDARLRHRFNPRFSNYMGYRFKDVLFKSFPLKDQESSTLFYGADYEVPGWFTVFGELGYESKDFKDPDGSITITSTDPTFPFSVTTPFASRRSSDNHVNFLVGVESNLSRYNTVSLTYNSRIVESSRPEFSQYLGKTFAVNSRHFLDNKTILFNSLFLEVQDFDEQDVFDLLFADGDATTKVYASGVTLRRILNDWLYFDVGYTYTRRTSDFPGEGSNNSRFRFGAQATF